MVMGVWGVVAAVVVMMRRRRADVRRPPATRSNTRRSSRAVNFDGDESSGGWPKALGHKMFSDAVMGGCLNGGRAVAAAAVAVGGGI
jgi:hypothetical protein